MRFADATAQIAPAACGRAAAGWADAVPGAWDPDRLDVHGGADTARTAWGAPTWRGYGEAASRVQNLHAHAAGALMAYTATMRCATAFADDEAELGHWKAYQAFGDLAKAYRMLHDRHGTRNDQQQLDDACTDVAVAALNRGGVSGPELWSALLDAAGVGDDEARQVALGLVADWLGSFTGLLSAAATLAEASSPSAAS